MLCLSNGERIKLSAAMHMVFEVNDLSVASPATVSRCGMVYMEAVYIGQAPYVTSWTQGKLVKTLPQHVQRFDKLLNKYAIPAIDWFFTECREGLSQGIAAQVLRSMFKILDAVLLPAYGVQQGKGGVEGMINMWFIFAFIWAIGGNAHDDSRNKFDAYVRDCGSTSARVSISHAYKKTLAAVSSRVIPLVAAVAIALTLPAHHSLTDDH